MTRTRVGQLVTVPRGIVGTLTDDVARAFGDALYQAFRLAHGDTAPPLTLGVGSVRIRLELPYGPIRDLAEKAFAPLTVEDHGGHGELVLCAWDSATAGVSVPDASWAWSHWRYESPNTVIVHEPRRLSFTDLEFGRSVVWFASPSDVPSWEKPAPFRRPLAQLLASRRRVVLHGGAVGTDHAALVITGPGGRGKSSTVMTCVRAGMRTLGDDYLVLEPDRDEIHALFATARLLPSSPAWQPGVDSLDNATPPVDSTGEETGPANQGSQPSASPDTLDTPDTPDTPEKATVYLAERHPAALLRRLPISAVLIPEITAERTTRITPMARFAALRELAPSSLLQVEAGQAGLSRLTRLVSEKPVYRLRLGSSTASVVEQLTDLLGNNGQLR